MALKHVETTVGETTIQMRYADHPDPAKATEWFDFQVKIADLRMVSGTPVKDLESHYLAVVRQVALRYVRDVIGEETQRLATLAGRIS